MSIEESSNDRSIIQTNVSHSENTASRSQPNDDRTKATLNRSSSSEIGNIDRLTKADGPISIAAIPAIKK